MIQNLLDQRQAVSNYHQTKKPRATLGNELHAPNRLFDRDKQVFVFKKQEKEELTVLDTLPGDNARQTGH
jgi:hypothetical protein